MMIKYFDPYNVGLRLMFRMELRVFFMIVAHWVYGCRLRVIQLTDGV